MTTELQPDPSRIELGRFYPHPPEIVWRALTEPALLDRWLMASTGFTAEEGAHFLLSVASEAAAEIAGEILVVSPHEAMTWSWMDLRFSQPPRWIVVWELHAQGRGTRLLLTHSGFDISEKRHKMARNALERGWRQLLSTKLVDVLDEL